MAQIRIINVDFYMNPPLSGFDCMYSEFRGNSIHQVPVLRIFGTNSTGKKTCLHVHGVFPYIYVPYDGDISPSTVLYQVASSLDKSINVSLGQASSNAQHVYKVSLMSGIPFYGYHAREHQFLKIFFYNPFIIKKACVLLQSGNILGRTLQPHEAHIPYVLQFMIDYNLHGMSFITLSQIKYRFDSDLDVPPDLLSPPSLHKQSVCKIEADALADHILNRLDVVEGKLSVNPGIKALWDDERQRRRNKDEDSQISACLTQTRLDVPPTATHVALKNVLRDRITVAVTKENLSETPSSQSLSNTSGIDPCSQSSDTTLNNSVVFDEDAQNLFDLLKSLRDNVENDSILSQVPKEHDSEDEIDLSLPLLNSLQTPVKIDEIAETGSDPEEFDDSYFNATICIPQLDGSSSSPKKSTNSKTRNVKHSYNLRSVSRRSPTINNNEDFQNRYLDGTNDSSSEDDVKVKPSAKKRRKLLSQYESKKYSPLSVTFRSPSKPVPKDDGGFPDKLNETTSSKSLPKRDEEVTTSLHQKKTGDNSQTKHKRKLTFAPIGSSNTTLTEEALLCRYTRNRKRQHAAIFTERNEEVNAVRDEQSESDRFSDDLFSPENAENDAVDEYDLQQNFVPQAGPSNTTGDGLIVSAPKYNPPTRDLIESTLTDYLIPQVRYEEPFYGDCDDVTGNVEVGGSVLRIPSKTVSDLAEFESFTKGIEFYRRRAIENLAAKEKLTGKEVASYKMAFCKDSDCVIKPACLPPTRSEVENWSKLTSRVKTETIVSKERVKITVPCSPGADSCDSLSISPCTPMDDKEMVKENSCRITGASFDNTYNFATSLNNLREAKSITEHQYLSVLSMELHVQTRADFNPNPEFDPIRAVFYSVHDDAPDSVVVSAAFVFDDRKILDGIDCDLKFVDSEIALLNEFVAFVENCDPDVMVGYEIETLSWGYLVERGYVLGLNLVSLLSRIPTTSDSARENAELRVTGRILLDFWRLMRHEVALQSYTFENIVYHILHRRVPSYSFKDLSFWWDHPTSLFRHRTVLYYVLRVRTILTLMDQLDLIGRTSELARLFGIQFYEVLSRGSQFRVESMMLRLAKPLNYVAVSPNVQQKAKMRAPESLPLIMEPESKFYTDPVIVLDFQSLYPSVIIGYNYCFSTCLGRIEHLGRNVPFEFGTDQLKQSRRRLNRLLDRDEINFAPCGVAFVKSEIRRGILPRMLQEILDTRLMVKKSMKENPDNRVLQKVLHARQLGLKLIANVTYGYTAANYSGRMPAVEVADSVVSKGRETLQRAIKSVETNAEWGARVVYGDTDSLFVLVAGRSREDAFKIGSEIAEAVTQDNPSPVKLKLEKVFQPCILQTKKRYVGYMYESVRQTEPEFCAKGIETVRRDGCPATSKMLEKCLKMLFETRDVSLIRKYVVRQFSKLLTGRVSVQDLTFAKEYRGASGYRPGACVPALELARKWTSVDKRREPRSGERIPYVIVNGPPGLPLIRLVRSPRDLLADSSLRPNALYYITKAIIPPINRCFTLIGADLNTWFNGMPRKHIQYLPSSSPTKGKKSTISQYFSTTSCALCGQQTREGLCVDCDAKTQESAVLLHEKVRVWEKNQSDADLICRSCCGRFDDLVCVSLDCPVLYRRTQTEKDLQQSAFVRHLISKLPPEHF